MRIAYYFAINDDTNKSVFIYIYGYENIIVKKVSPTFLNFQDHHGK